MMEVFQQNKVNFQVKSHSEKNCFKTKCFCSFAFHARLIPVKNKGFQQNKVNFSVKSLGDKNYFCQFFVGLDCQTQDRLVLPVRQGLQAHFSPFLEVENIKKVVLFIYFRNKHLLEHIQIGLKQRKINSNSFYPCNTQLAYATFKNQWQLPYLKTYTQLITSNETYSRSFVLLKFCMLIIHIVTIIQHAQLEMNLFIYYDLNSSNLHYCASFFLKSCLVNALNI